MDLSQRDRLSDLVEELTTSGEPQLNQDKMKEVKRISKVSNDYVDHVYRSVMSQLSQEHAEIRLSAFQIATELFSRSHHFRTLLVDNFQEFLELTVETDTDLPLPPPKEVAKKLRLLALQTVQSWQNCYGSVYKKLALGYHFLKQVKKVDFQDAEARTVAERRREEDRRQRLERIYKDKVDAAVKDMEDSHQEIEATLTELDSCIKLLCPEFDISDLQTSSSSVFTESQSKSPPDDEQPCCSKDVRDGRIKRKKGAKEVESSRKKVQETCVEMETQDEVKKRRKRGGQKEEKGEENQWEREDLQREREMEECDDDDDDEEEEEIHGEDFIRNTGLISHSYTLDLSLSPGLQIKETEDNEAVVATVIDLHKLITTKHLPAVESWIQVFTKSGAEQQLLRRALDLKKSLEAALKKHNELHIDYKMARVRRVITASSDEDEDFQEVPEKEGYEAHIPEELRQEYGLDPGPSTAPAPVTSQRPVKTTAPPPPSTSASSRRLKRWVEEEKDPTCAAATLHLLRQRLVLPPPPSISTGSNTPVSSSQQKTADAPVVPFGLDLYYWGQDQPNAGKIIKAVSQHQFWVPHDVEEEVENKDMLAESKSRFISFPGSFTPVSHHCRAPLGHGKLCQRQDRLKCPFHGRIIPRDEAGRPCREEDRLREEQRKREGESGWQDVELMRDIEAATGEDLGSDRVAKKGKRKKKKKKYPNLSDLKQNANTSRSRLEKKVFNKSAMSRVAQMLAKVDKRKHDKFSNQFNYALK